MTNFPIPTPVPSIPPVPTLDSAPNFVTAKLGELAVKWNKTFGTDLNTAADDIIIREASLAQTPNIESKTGTHLIKVTESSTKVSTAAYLIFSAMNNPAATTSNDTNQPVTVKEVEDAYKTLITYQAAVEKGADQSQYFHSKDYQANLAERQALLSVASQYPSDDHVYNKLSPKSQQLVDEVIAGEKLSQKYAGDYLGYRIDVNSERERIAKDKTELDELKAERKDLKLKFEVATGEKIMPPLPSGINSKALSKGGSPD